MIFMALPFGPLGHFFLTSDSCHPRFFILTDLKTTSVFRPVCCRLHCFVVSHPTTGWLPSRPCFHKKQSSWRDTFPSFHHFPLDVSTHTYDVYNPVLSQTFVGFFLVVGGQRNSLGVLYRFHCAGCWPLSFRLGTTQLGAAGSTRL